MSLLDEMSTRTGVTYSDEQRKVLEHTGGMNILACAGSGKALKNGTKVLTSEGYMPIERLRVGDLVYDKQGMIQQVIGVYPQPLKAENRLHLENGATIPCCIDHLWEYAVIPKGMVNHNESGSSYKMAVEQWKVGTFGEIHKLLQEQNVDVFVPIANEVDFVTAKPSSWEIMGDDEILKMFVDIYDIAERLDTGLPENIVYGDLDVRAMFINTLISYMAIYNKVVLTGNRYNVAESLRYKDAQFSISIKSEKLAHDVQSIFETLGYVCRIEQQTGRPDQIRYRQNKSLLDEHSVCYDLTITHPTMLGGQAVLRIESTECLDELVEMTCIQVSGETKLFLTEHCVATHNTTVLTHLIAKRIISGEISDPSKILCTTFSKAGSTEMEDRLKALLKELGVNAKVSVKTLHATYNHVLKHFGLTAGNNVCSNAQRLMFVTQAIKESKLKLEDDDIKLVDSLLSFQVNNLLDDASLTKSYVYTLEDVPLEKYSEIRKRYNQKKYEAGLIDFDDMQLYMYMIVVQQKNPAVINYCRSLWEYFFVDEFQDVSKIQFAILRELVSDPNKLVVIGDDDQCIYQWRGADPNIILNICGYYDISKFALTTNYRCKSTIVDHAAVGIKYNQKRSDKGMKAFNSGGRIRIADTGAGNLWDITLPVYKYIMKLVYEDGEDPANIAVLSRNNQHLCILNNMLFKSGIFSEASDEMKLTSISIYKDIKDIFEIAEGTYNHRVVGKQLWKLVPYLGTKNANAIAKFMDEIGCSLKDALSLFVNRYTDGSCAYKVTRPIKISDKMDRYMENIGFGLKPDTLHGLVRITNVIANEETTQVAGELLQWYLAGTEFMYNSKDKSRTVIGLVNYMLSLVDSEGIEATKTFMNLTENYEKGKQAVIDSKITMSTMHGAKGREWKHVIIFADDNITFPSFEGICKMAEDGVDTTDIHGSIDENRRLHYVAMTRAKENLVIFANAADVSVYTLEALGLMQMNAEYNDATIVDMALGNGALDSSLVVKARELILTPTSPYFFDASSFADKSEMDLIDGEDDEEMADVIDDSFI